MVPGCRIVARRAGTRFPSQARRERENSFSPTFANMRCILFTLCSRPYLHTVYNNSLTEWNRHHHTLPPMYQVDSCGSDHAHFEHISRIEYVQREPASRRPTGGPSRLEHRALLHALRVLPGMCRTVVKVTGKYYIRDFAHILKNFSDSATVVQSRTDAWLQRSDKCGGHHMKSSEVFQVPVDRLYDAMLRSHRDYMECTVSRLSNVSHFGHLALLHKVPRSDGSVLPFF